MILIITETVLRVRWRADTTDERTARRRALPFSAADVFHF